MVETEAPDVVESVDSILDEERIRIRAHELFVARNCEPGHADDDWFQAEQEILGKRPAEG